MLARLLLAAALAVAAPGAAQPATDPVPEAAAFAPTRFSVEVEGSGRDIVLIPGLASGREVWDEAVAALGGEYRVHRLQLAGFAGEPAAGNEEGGILPGVVEELRLYIEANELERSLLVGHSMGGLIALMTAIAHPDEVGKIMIVDSLPFFGTLMGAPNAASIKPQADAMRDMIAELDDEAFERAQRANMGSMVGGEEDRAALVRMSLESDRDIFARAMHETMLTDVRPALAKLEVPVTMVYPHNAAIPAARAKALYEGAYQGAAQVTFVPVADSRHFIMLDQPDRFAEILKALAAPDLDR